ncbi:MAG: PorT family protein [Tannerellaceae bacterium]|nr:PorT family protein [Tannerellaceae bacterium]
MRNKVLLLLCLFLTISVTAQERRTIRTENKVFNWGATVGLKSSLPIINSLTIDGKEANNIQTHYQVGYTASLFGRINMRRIFLQPSISWHHSSSELRFLLPSGIEGDEDILDPLTLNMTFETIEIPVLVGYNVIKEGPYGLSLMAGPQLKYNYKTDYTFNFSNSQNRFGVNRNYFDINIVTGVAVSIWRLFFDFKYEFGLNKQDSDFKNQNPSESTITDISFDKRINVMSFSLGFLF